MITFRMKWFLVIVISLFVIAIEENLAQYVPPTPSIEPLYPKGLRMSIPDDDGISLVAYHVKFNEDFNGLEAGTIARDIVKRRNGRWTYEDRTTRLKRGTVIYYWIHVVYDGLGYNLIDQSYVVNEFYNYDGTPVGNIPTGCATPSETKIYSGQETSHTVCAGQLIFEDNFDNLNTTRWKVIERFADAPDYEFVVYMKDHVEINEGNLHIVPSLTNEKYGPNFIEEGTLNLESCTGEPASKDCTRTRFGPSILPPIISGRLNTKPSFNFLYGRIEIRAKLPHGDWIFPLLTLEKAEKYTTNTPVFYIIVAHSNGNPTLRLGSQLDLSGHVLLGGAYTMKQSQQSPQNNLLDLPKKVSNSLWSNDYHLYELEWRRGKVTLKVDGEQYGEQKVPALYETPFYLNIGVAVGGHNNFPDCVNSGNYEKPWKNVEVRALNSFHRAENNWRESWRYHNTGLHVDYVKVWAI